MDPCIDPYFDLLYKELEFRKNQVSVKRQKMLQVEQARSELLLMARKLEKTDAHISSLSAMLDKKFGGQEFYEMFPSIVPPSAEIIDIPQNSEMVDDTPIETEETNEMIQ